jgi:hypothetical protein
MGTNAMYYDNFYCINILSWDALRQAATAAPNLLICLTLARHPRLVIIKAGRWALTYRTHSSPSSVISP